MGIITANQWAFQAITGYEPPDNAGASASVDDWQDMTTDQLIDEITAQVEHHLPAIFDPGDVILDDVIKAIEAYKQADSSQEAWEAFDSLTSQNAP